MTLCTEKENQLKALFAACSSKEEKYQKIIELGQKLPPLDKSFKTEENLVQGCQSIMHLHCWEEDGKLFFLADSAALISKGLAALLIFVYSGQPKEALLNSPPSFLSELGIEKALSPGRSNGLLNLFLKMRAFSKTKIFNN